jgi:hypothetical protein
LHEHIFISNQKKKPAAMPIPKSTPDMSEDQRTESDLHQPYETKESGYKNEEAKSVVFKRQNSIATQHSANRLTTPLDKASALNNQIMIEPPVVNIKRKVL